MDELQKRFKDVCGNLEPSSDLYKQGASQWDRGASAINGSADSQRAQARQQLEDQTQKAEAEAARSGLTREQTPRGDALGLMLGGPTPGQMASYCGAGTTQPPQSTTEQHLHVHAVDGESALNFLMNNKHNVRAAMNQSYAENSGGSDLG